MRSQGIGEGGKDAYHLALFAVAEVADLVIDLQHLGWFQKDSLPGGRLVVDKAFDSPFIFRQHGNDHAPPPNGDAGIVGSEPLPLGVAQNLVQHLA